MLTFRIGATVGAAYKSGIFGRGGALAGVVSLLVIEVLNEGVNFVPLEVSIFFK